ncbi:hypothetical protein QQP08_001401 [Theobroma cacao]|nr:hypothetical protein QQP08_001401 [Theobroma cacao]
MASLVLLLEALMIFRCQNHDLLSNKIAKETPYNTNHDVGKQGYHGYIWSSMSQMKEEDARTWKIAECCIWP